VIAEIPDAILCKGSFTSTDRWNNPNVLQQAQPMGVLKCSQ
jgi:hypothetical protein